MADQEQNKATDKAPTLLQRIASGETIVSDGGTGTYLQRHGLEPGGCPEAFNRSRPDVVRTMARRYFAAGANIALTNSFGGSRFMLGRYGREADVAELNRLAAEHARSQAPPGAFVIGSVGPTGEFLQPLGELSEAEMLDGFAEQIAALADGGIDGVVIETMSALEEANIALRAAREYPGLVVMATMTFDIGPRGFFTMMGVSPERAAAELADAGADVVGANCGNGADVMLDLMRRMRGAADIPLLAHCNAGIPAVLRGEIVYPETPEYMAPRFKRMADEIGVNIVGGCCGTAPEHIRALSAAVRPQTQA